MVTISLALLVLLGLLLLVVLGVFRVARSPFPRRPACEQSQGVIPLRQLRIVAKNFANAVHRQVHPLPDHHRKCDGHVIMTRLILALDDRP